MSTTEIPAGAPRLARKKPGNTARLAALYRSRGQLVQAEALEAALVAATRCRSCGRRLTDERSIEVGIGPDCAAKGAGP